MLFRHIAEAHTLLALSASLIGLTVVRELEAAGEVIEIDALDGFRWGEARRNSSLMALHESGARHVLQSLTVLPCNEVRRAGESGKEQDTS